MNLSIVLALIASVLNAGNDLIYSKKSRNDEGKGTMSFYLLSSLFSAIIAFFLMIILPEGKAGSFFSRQDILFGILLGVLSFCTYFLFIMSFNGINNSSISSTIYRMNMIPGVLLAVFLLGEEMNTQRGLAILACIISIALFSSWRFNGLNESSHLLYSIGACLFGAVLNVANKIAVMQGGIPFKLLFWRFVVVSIIAGIIVCFKKSWTIDVERIKYAFFSGLSLMLAIYMILSAFKTSDVAIVLPITQLSFIIVAVVSWLLFGEHMNKKKAAGIILAIGAVLLMK